jgi:SAM-dependent methyltransferase
MLMIAKSNIQDLRELVSRSPLLERDCVLEFIADSGDYCENFGKQWNRFREIQIDSLQGSRESHNRFYSETQWKPEELTGKLLLDAGCGAGRFAEVALEAGARVVAVDLSSAIYACQKTLSRFPKEN